MGTSDLQPLRSPSPASEVCVGVRGSLVDLSIFSLISLGQIDFSEFIHVQYFSFVTFLKLILHFFFLVAMVVFWFCRIHTSCLLSFKYIFKGYSFKITAFKLLIVFPTLRFAQFFLCPLFDESCKDREVNAVDSEHEKNVMNDAWRLFQLEKATGNPKHPFSKFGTGL